MPKAFAKLRRARLAGRDDRAERARRDLHHAAEALHRLAERDVAALLRQSRRWGGLDLHALEPRLATNRARMPFAVAGRGGELVVAFEQREGWLIASVESRGWLDGMDDRQRGAWADALAGLYKSAGVHVVREQAGPLLNDPAFDAADDALVAGGSRYDYDQDAAVLRGPGDAAVPRAEALFADADVTWEAWVERWEEDRAGKTPAGGLTVQRVM